MPFETKDSIRFFAFPSLQGTGVVQAVFTRQGGVSPSPWRSLNVGGTVGDERARVVENRLRAFRAVGRSPATLHDVWQVHSADYQIATAPRGANTAYKKADILITDRPEVTLFMRFADCVPVYLLDPARGVIALAHAGWLGTARHAARAAVAALSTHFGSRPEDLLAGIGPSIGPDHYEIREDVISHFRRSFGRQADELLLSRNGTTHLDLWQANRLDLEMAGVGQIEVAGLCTACHPQEWFSHRGEAGRTGRFGALFGLAS